MNRALVSTTLLALTALTSAAHALTPTPVDALRCGDGLSLARPRGLCHELASAPRLPSTDPRAMAALAVWARLADPVEALTERTTGIVLLAPDARQRDGRELAPAAWICPGAPPVIYVPHSLLEATYAPSTGLGEDFLAFVLAHELGHRVNDFTVDGCPASFSGGPATARAPAIDHERRADFRGAFFAAVAGFDPRALARTDTISRFLALELRARQSDVASREAALAEALGWFDALEDLYQAGLALTLAGERGAAPRFLARLDEALGERAIPLPEVTLTHALSLLADAAHAAPWLAAIDRLPAPREALACHPVHPAHGAFFDATYDGRVRADPARRLAARRAIERARRLIDRADDLGAAPLAVASARACAALYAGDPHLAQSLAAAADKRATRASPAVRATLAANLALSRFAAWLDAAPAPDPAEHPDWLSRLAAERSTFASHAALDRYVASLVGQPSTPPHNGAPLCARPAETPPPLPLLPALGPLAAPPGRCPAGWDRFETPDDERHLAICRRAGRSLVRASLPPLADPPLPAIDAAVVLLGAPPPALRLLEDWACGCQSLSPRGVSDLGESVFLATCPRLGLPLGLVFADQKNRVRRLAALP